MPARRDVKFSRTEPSSEEILEGETEKFSGDKLHLDATINIVSYCCFTQLYKIRIRQERTFETREYFTLLEIFL